ncbi:MAG: hypothetical protein SH856_06155 [Flavobacteriales bacterium]|nr:hypothetical protein [Flavobacteriales bacterium]
MAGWAGEIQLAKPLSRKFEVGFGLSGSTHPISFRFNNDAINGSPYRILRDRYDLVVLTKIGPFAWIK